MPRPPAPKPEPDQAASDAEVDKMMSFREDLAPHDRDDDHRAKDIEKN
jgi:hypothetical protein